MKTSTLLCALPTIFVLASAAPTDDMESLRTSCENAANVLNASLNITAALNTSDIIQSIVWQIGASDANLEGLNASNVSNTTSNTTAPFDWSYFDYIDSTRTLSESLIRRGCVVHGELNLPVYNTMQSLSSIIQTYGMTLSNANLISRDATIRTYTAISSLVDAESAWANNGSEPGWRSGKRFARR